MAERDDNGRFIKGNKASPGRTKRLIEERYLKRFSSTVKVAEWREIILKAIDQAKRGDPRARQWLSDYLVGKPIQGIELEQDGNIILKVVHDDEPI